MGTQLFGYHLTHQRNANEQLLQAASFWPLDFRTDFFSRSFLFCGFKGYFILVSYALGIPPKVEAIPLLTCNFCDPPGHRCFHVTDSPQRRRCIGSCDCCLHTLVFAGYQDIGRRLLSFQRKCSSSQWLPSSTLHYCTVDTKDYTAKVETKLSPQPWL